MYPLGINDTRIGSDAACLPVRDNFFAGVAVTCSIEHFEDHADIRFMREMGRVLVKGGKIAVVPLYLYIQPTIQTDPRYSIPGQVTFDEGAAVHCVKDWSNRHGRFYSPDTLYKRLIKPNENIHFNIHLIDNAMEIHESIYCRFMMLGTKM